MDIPNVVTTSQKIVLVGTPNCGKTSLFNSLTGLNQRVGNFAGVTVERKSAELTLRKTTARLIDLPGVNNLYPESEDEKITCDILRNPHHEDHPDMVIVVADATQLRRGLALCTQVIDLGFPTILAINMADLLKKENIQLDTQKLSYQIGIPVVSLSVLKKQGISELKRFLISPLSPPQKPIMKIPGGFSSTLNQIKELVETENDYLAFQILLDPQNFNWISQEQIYDLQHSANISADSHRLISNELIIRYDYADELIKSTVYKPAVATESISSRIDSILTHRIWGYLIFLAVLVIVFQSIFSWANYPMGAIESWVEQLKTFASGLLPDGWLTRLLVEGIITGFGGIIVFIPQIAFLFLFVSVMEESGYMSRVVFLMDRIMRPFGFSGKSIIPLMGGMACAIPSIMMTRSIPSKQERLITIMVTPLMSCSARIPVYTLLIAMFIPPNRILGIDQRGLIMTGLYFLGFIMALLVAWVFKKVLRYQSDGIFVMEMPGYRMPRWKNVLLTVYQRSLDFVFGAGKIILAISIILWLLVSYGPGTQREAIQHSYEAQISQIDSPVKRAQLEEDMQTELLEHSYAAYAGKWIEPMIRPLGYDWKIGISLITSFAAREVFVGTMSIIYNQEDPGSAEDEVKARSSLIERLRAEKDPDTGKKIYTPAVVFSLIIFYAFAMQCMSTLAVTQREVGWFWTGIMFVYLTVLAYGAAWITYLLLS